MESLSLYDLLVGSFVFRGDAPGDEEAASYFDRLTEEEKLRNSIVENLKMVLQSRRESIKHLPDFGIPDILQIYRDERSIDPVTEQIRDTILKYEPRLSSVEVKQKSFDKENLRLSLEIFAKIKQSSGKDLLLTEFSTTGWVKVVFEKDQQKEEKNKIENE